MRRREQVDRQARTLGASGWPAGWLAPFSRDVKGDSMKTSHTPGPWHLSGYRYVRDNAAPAARRARLCDPYSDLCEGYIISDENAAICDIKSHRRGADARLIAAAPDLLAALDGLFDEVWALVDDGTLDADFVNEHKAIVSARAALVKARGE